MGAQTKRALPYRIVILIEICNMGMKGHLGHYTLSSWRNLGGGDICLVLCGLVASRNYQVSSPP